MGVLGSSELDCDVDGELDRDLDWELSCEGFFWVDWILAFLLDSFQSGQSGA